jgi:hypothetical protein
VGREEHDDLIPAREVLVGDEVHVTVMGGDEYMSVRKAEHTDGHVQLTFSTWGGDVDDDLDPEYEVWVRRSTHTAIAAEQARARTLRGRLARWLVRSVAQCWERSLHAHEVGAHTAARYWAEKAKGSDWRRRAALRLHKDAAVDEMVQWGFWG